MAFSPKSVKNLNPPLKKGHPPLPGAGRPKGRRSISDALRQILAASAKKLPIGSEMAKIAAEFKLDKVSDVMALKMILLGFSKNPSASLSAIKESMDRTEGQAAQTINLLNDNLDFTKLTKEQLQLIAAGKSLGDIGIDETK